ncbi:aminopeptidase, partial [Klebsiella pneumoniae]|nr:aminopeptidase [Klebsiella pneumoniae]
MNKTTLKNYAKVIVKMGANVQKNQDVVISASTEIAYFVEYVVSECYKAKARSVTVEWNNDAVARLKNKNENVDV